MSPVIRNLELARAAARTARRIAERNPSDGEAWRKLAEAEADVASLEAAFMVQVEASRVAQRHANARHAHNAPLRNRPFENIPELMMLRKAG